MLRCDTSGMVAEENDREQCGEHRNQVDEDSGTTGTDVGYAADEPYLREKRWQRSDERDDAHADERDDYAEELQP